MKLREPQRAARAGTWMVLLIMAAGKTQAQPVPIPLDPARWSATDSIRFETYLGRPALYINRGVAIAKGVELTDGVLEFSVAGTSRSNFAGISFHAARPDFAEILFFRFGQSGTSQAVQYGPALNNLGAAWQVYHGPGANAVASLDRDRWIKASITLVGGTATLRLDGAADPTLVVPGLAGTGGNGVGVWTGLFGQGAYYSDFSFTPAASAAPRRQAPGLPPGTLVDWEISQSLDAAGLLPGTLPPFDTIRWERVPAEPDGVVLINRYRAAPTVFVPFDRTTGKVVVDSVMTGRVAGSRVVLARTIITADRPGYRRMHFGYSDGVVIHANGQPLFFGMNAQFFRGDGLMSRAGDAVYLPLRAGPNEVVLAVTEFTGGWGFWARLDPD